MNVRRLGCGYVGAISQERGEMRLLKESKVILSTKQQGDTKQHTDDNGDIVGYTAIELFDHLMNKYVQPKDVADQVTALHKILKQDYDPNEEPQVYYKLTIGIANAVEEQVDQNKENQRILAQATVEANNKIDQLEKQTAQLYAALMVKQPPQLQQQSKHWKRNQKWRKRMRLIQNIREQQLP
ncbi:hypothetical protein FRACYDRAFT_248014 [Fragilariopsis cylindrus CCMP1102]|uniref:Uncharacterized protein n=1 Tax=Fragilariopsis cylindrus CCMP1102 TaxID=635003 RepID=A0A1E7EV79_9STRA|nr:hypothetical protein FRACYDRAFT_248014 [Fragilariopsis cylindrus CCMP1102]|eukprot:OEU09757.1 hypothetical protein FRACYDRAFT_248014 [Fragilariopsis cylindrus CCMP1102]